uniref:Uncharacterized protein n=1 Tax=Glossina austeni TaxID=7395 RepID=A0A1A9VTY5_GLOAU
MEAGLKDSYAITKCSFLAGFPQNFCGSLYQFLIFCLEPFRKSHPEQNFLYGLILLMHHFFAFLSLVMLMLMQFGRKHNFRSYMLSNSNSGPRLPGGTGDISSGNRDNGKDVAV